MTILYIKKEKDDLLASTYQNSHKSTKKFISSLIEDKQNATITIAVALAKDDRLYNYMKNKDYDHFEYNKISNQMRKYTRFENVWIQIVNNKGQSIYRSWDTLKHDDLHFRKDVKQTLKSKDITRSISVGKYDLSIKARCPIFDLDNSFLGFIEVITHFNSIAQKLKEHKIHSIIIVDKKFNKRIKYPFSKRFINDYYLVNKNAQNKYINIIKNKNIEEFLHLKKYKIIDNKLLISYKLKDRDNEYLGSILTFIELKDIDTKKINLYHKQTIILATVILLIILILFILYVYYLNSSHSKRLNRKLKNHIKQLRIQEGKKQSILDSQSNIIVITNGEEIINANIQLFEFYKNVRNLKEFKEKYYCICNTFLDIDTDNSYIKNIDYDGKNWAEYILFNSHKHFKVAIKNHKNVIRHFSINVSKRKVDNYLIVTLTDITHIMEQKEELKYLNNNLEKIIENKTKELKELNESLEDKIKDEIYKSKEKDRLIFQQSKITAIADTLKNIAHQWRQPLSSISTATSGMQLQKEMNVLDDEEFERTCNTIIQNTRKLSKTIDNFTNYFIEEKCHTNFSILEATNNSIKFLESIFHENEIEVVFNYDQDFIINGFKVEFQQCITNLLDNSIFALSKIKDKNKRVILLNIKNKKLHIKDSGNGIEEKNLSKIFEPYFTTKHQSYGIGLGLYMVHELLTKHMHYKIDIKNCEFSYKNDTYKGAEIIIDFN
ncbi:ATP-binding protein [Arcobacter sp. CECT 8985]|uniref:sensor histidine kinase n=1 Tax=Arcobacter sp. CECT 8985 TaxID=1935424 RepID=UPI0013E99316|nr:ATP-binding protein [Arcobacter sp. CECT 8985]